MQDFEVVELIDFPTKGTTLTPPHEFGEFTFQVNKGSFYRPHAFQSYAPLAMRYFRDIFDISVEGYIHSIIHEPLSKISMSFFVNKFHFKLQLETLVLQDRFSGSHTTTNLSSRQSTTRRLSF